MSSGHSTWTEEYTVKGGTKLYRWRCSCGASGHGAQTRYYAKMAALAHKKGWSS